MRWLNEFVPFSNAGVQGLVRFLKTARNHPKAFTAAFMRWAVIPTLAVRFINMMADEEEYGELPPYLRDLFYNIKMGPNMWIRIPKAYEIGVLSSGVERMVDTILGKEDAWTGYSGSVAKAMIPVEDVALVGPFKSFIENMANYDFFRDKHIIPPHEENLKLMFRDTDTASRLGQTLQEVFNVDARKIDHFIKNQFAYPGIWALDLSDIGREDMTMSRMIYKTGISAFAPAGTSRSANKFMTIAKEYGLTGKKQYRQFVKELRKYYDLPTDKQKDRQALNIRNMARKLTPIFEKMAKEKERQYK
jgi:hypothetical protein